MRPSDLGDLSQSNDSVPLWADEGELGKIGVARLSVGPGVAQAAYAAAQRAARELLEQGTYRALESGLPFAELNAMFAQRSTAKAE